jgi:hypothetical protein
MAPRMTPVDTAVAYSLTRIPMHLAMVAALAVGGVAGWSALRVRVGAPEATTGRVLAVGLPIVALVVMIFVTLARTWSHFDAVEAATADEASAAMAVARLAHTLPTDEGAIVRGHVCAYVRDVAASEFPAMSRGEMPAASSPHLVALAVAWGRAAAPPAIVAEAFRALHDVHVARNRRASAVEPMVPPSALLLGLLTLVAFVRVSSVSLGGPPQVRFVVTSLVVFVSLAAALLVLQFSLPFAGDLTVDVDPFLDAANAVR